MKYDNTIPFEILSSGSEGNATVVNNFLLIDCGTPVRAIKPHIKALKLVLVTHIHSDHFKRLTAKSLAKSRPTLRFAGGHFLADAFIKAGVEPRNIDVLEADVEYDYGLCKIIPVELSHNVPCFGYKIRFADGRRLFYATDTNNLNGIRAQGYDLYMIEANYTDSEIEERIREKKVKGEYAYEYEVLKNHLSREKCDKFLADNAGQNSGFVYMHIHKDTPKGEGDGNDGENNQIGR